jgi:uncharacterized protein YjbI with pentapeptide repeats
VRDNVSVRGSARAEDSKPKKGWLVRGKAADEAVHDAEKHRRGPGRLLVFFVLLAMLSGVALWLVPLWQVAPARDRLSVQDQLTPTQRLVLENDLFQAENSARSTLALILAASGLLLGIGIGWRRLEISREERTHERFARAVEQLASDRSDGSARTEARLGGIYALERLLADSDREYWPVMEVLTAYVRENAPLTDAERSTTSGPLHPAADIQAILAVLGRRKPHATTGERRLLDLRATDLRGANLSGSRLGGVTFHGANLDHVDATRAILSHSNLREVRLAGASLTEADLEGASLSRVNLEGARLNGANLKGADLSGANLRGADLWEANLKGCNLKDADLRGADLSQSMLEEAILWRADLQDAVLTGAALKETHLERANLSGVTGLTWEQGEDAFTDENTILPDYLLPEQVRQTLAATAHLVPPPPPTPAARRALPRRPAPATPPPPAPSPAPAPIAEPKDNVVQIKSARRNAATARAAKAQQVEPPTKSKSKKTALPKHRKPGLVKPA